MQTRDFLRVYESATNTKRAKLTRLHEEASEDVARGSGWKAFETYKFRKEREHE